MRPESDQRPLARGFVAARRIRCGTVFAALALIAGPRWAAVAQPWGRVLAVSVALAVATEIFEQRLGHVPGPPQFFLEELFELIAAIGFMVAALARPRA